MEKYTMINQELSDEQLQTITGGVFEITQDNLHHAIRNEMPAHYDLIHPELQKSVNRMIRSYDRLGGATGIRGTLQVWKQGNTDDYTDQTLARQKRRFARIMLG